MPRRIAVLDAETDPFKAGRHPKPFKWGFYDGSSYRSFTVTAAVIDFLRGEDCICYAHNGGRFDFHFLLDGLDEYSELMIINGRLAQLRMGVCELRDSYSILPVRLAAYAKDKIDYAIFEASERDKPANARKIDAYLKSDCVYLWELVTQFIERYGLHLTQAGAAMKVWQKIADIKAPRTDEDFYDALAPYYYGGRVECFESGIIETDFSVLDINSAYPRAMLEKHPISVNYEQSARYLKNADFVRVRARSIGAWPYRGEGNPNHDAGLHFPRDGELREFTITGWEYRAAVDSGALGPHRVHESFRFCNHIDFAEFINRFYALRLEAKRIGDKAGDLFAKLLMNGLYGKFAANPANYRNYMIVPAQYAGSLPGIGWNFAGELGPWALAEAELSPEQMRYYNVATGASITGYVRAMLWQAIHESEGVLYCDTDSIAVRRPGDSIKLGAALGEWKHEGDFDRAGIGGKKLYIFRGVPGPDGEREYKQASKGTRLTKAQLWRVAAGGEVVHTKDVPTFGPGRKPTFITRRVRNTA